MSQVFAPDFQLLLDILPQSIATQLVMYNKTFEIVIDLGRNVEFRAPGDVLELELIADKEMINQILSKLSSPGEDNRCGLDGTLHRISIINNKKKQPVGMTIRIGKPFVGNACLLYDLLDTGKSILLVGAPGRGKSSLLRESARHLSIEFNKRVVIVDTSSEIAGEGDIPHEAVGKSRRLQVAKNQDQDDVMIEAVENHTPDVVVVDELSTNKEALAAQTISQRGVQLLATAHGNTINDIITNKYISEVVGGIDKVTISDDTMLRRGLNTKTVLERQGTSPFDCIVEINSFDEVSIYHDAEECVDAILDGRIVKPEVRRIIGGEILKLNPYHVQPIKEEHMEQQETNYNTNSYSAKRTTTFRTKKRR